MRFTALFSLVLFIYYTEAQKQQCSYPVNVQLVLDTSDSNLVRDDRLGATKRAIAELAEIHNFRPGVGGSRLGLCTYGTTAGNPINLNNNAHQNRNFIRRTAGNVVRDANDDFQITGFQPELGFARIHLGVSCAMNALRAARNGLPELIVIILLANDAITSARTLQVINEAKADGMFVTVITLGENFIDKQRVRNYASDGVVVEFSNTAAFVEDAALFVPRSFQPLCPAQLIPTTTTSTTTTTTRAIVLDPGGPCDNCIIVNGIGYARTDSCWWYWQCIMQDDGTWLQIRRKTAIASYWDQNIISQQQAAMTNCPDDVCVGQTDGSTLQGFDNCRALITCSAGQTIDVICCPRGERAGPGGCTPDSTCQEDCPESQITTPSGVAAAALCFLEPDPAGDPAKYFVVDNDVRMEMTCPRGTILSTDLSFVCGCIHSEGPFDEFQCLPNPEVDLHFTADGGVVDISRNGYSLNTVNLATSVDSSVVPTGYVGEFNGETLVRISNANSDISSEFTMRVVYQNRGSGSNTALVSNAECADSIPTAWIGASPNSVSGSVRTVPDDIFTTSGSAPNQRNTAVFHYRGGSIDVSVNGGAAQSVDTGPLLVTVGQTCDGIKLGLGKNQAGFVGQIVEFQLWKCDANPV